VAQGVQYAHELTTKGHLHVTEVAKVFYEGGFTIELAKYCITFLRDEHDLEGAWQNYILEECLEHQPYLAE
jgi:hypothetical protein